MHILVLDDNATHRASAKSLLKGHDVTIVGTYDEAQDALEKGTFDAYLGDLMLPASQQALAPEAMNLAGEEMPLGTTLALLAMMHKVKYVAVLTDTNHHKHPGAAAFDAFRSRWKGAFAVGDTKVLCGDNSFMCYVDEKTGEKVDYYTVLDTAEGKKRYPSTGWQTWEGICRAKDWARALEVLTSETKQA